MFNPAAEAFRNFDVDAQSGLVNHNLSLEHDEERRRGASRANSVRFDESANNHYGSSSRQSMDLLPLRTGSGLGSHPLSERSFSHRSDGKGSISGSMRANSFGLEQGRILGSMASSPKAAVNPPPAFYVLGPLPAIIRCWLTDTFSNDSLLYAAICTGSYVSSITTSAIQVSGLSDETFDESGVRKIRLPIYLTEAMIQQSSSRSASPVPQVPTLTAKFVVVESAADDRSIQVILGSDVLRAHNADIVFSQDKLMIFDNDRNRLSIPLVRPESEVTFKGLFTSCSASQVNGKTTLPNSTPAAGVIARPARGTLTNASAISSNATASTTSETDDQLKPESVADVSEKPTADPIATKPQDRPRPPLEQDPPLSTPTSASRANSGVWGGSWRTSSSQPNGSKTASTYARPAAARGMKVLRSGRSMASSSRGAATTTPTGNESTTAPPSADVRRPSLANLPANIESERSSNKNGEAQSQPTKANPVGQASAFGWLNSG